MVPAAPADRRDSRPTYEPATRRDLPRRGRARLSRSVLDGGIGQGRLPGFVLIRPQHDFALAVAEVINTGAGDALELNRQDACLFPLALLAKGNVAHHSLKGMGADVIGN